MDAIKTVDVAVANSLSGKTEVLMSTGVSYVRSAMPRKPASAPIKKRQRRRRRTRVDANTLLAIAQSALARLNDVGIGVYVDNWEGEWESGVVITLTGVQSKDKKLIQRNVKH